jgi:D-citramalate synthase
VLRRIIDLGDRKHVVSPEDLPYIISDVLKTPHEQMVRVQHYHVSVANDAEPHAEVTLTYQGNVEKAEAGGVGGYDAFMNAVKKAAGAFDLSIPMLEDFKLRIPPGGKTGALVETTITWKRELPVAKGRKPQTDSFRTMGVDSDQMGSAVIATEKMLNSVAQPRRKKGDAGGTRKQARVRRKSAGTK